MIQDIYPHKLHNEYHPDQSPRPDDAIICFVGNKILVGGKENAFTFPHRSELPGVSDGTYLFSLDRQAFYLVDGDFTGHSGSYRYHTLRDLRWHLKGPRENLYAAYTAYHLTTWYRENRFCGSCGQATVHATAERALHCPACGRVIYPRLNPAVIVGVTDGNRILMTKYANRDVSFYALIAGFTEIGESMEECVAREVMEEVGLKVKNLRYYKSQPWGSADDILLGFYCDADGATDIRLDEKELREAVWVERDAIEGQPDNLSLTNEMMMVFKAGREPR